MGPRIFLDELIQARGETYAGISHLLGRNSAYIQQYVKRGTPASLSARDQDILARYFGMPADFLRPTTASSKTSVNDQAIAHVRAAISACEALQLGYVVTALERALKLLESNERIVTRRPS
ncbi:hypothetical protein SAMIE_1016500 [Sphingobium amiense]|uniref:Uncharacterized protein n=1 Tax=Sphingobium amiense TaxID=135719 RepID=A0A494WCV9_9SPHN|nr:hypothetical protein [Sphingobium amiense]BBD98149.1 hypothetical protein SAMIE_1016500 [Sphingobium amiense]